MPITNIEAHEAANRGRNVIVVCGDCDHQVWTDDGVYDEQQDEWYCPDCLDGSEGAKPPGAVGGGQ